MTTTIERPEQTRATCLRCGETFCNDPEAAMCAECAFQARQREAPFAWFTDAVADLEARRPAVLDETSALPDYDFEIVACPGCGIYQAEWRDWKWGDCSDCRERARLDAPDYQP